MNSFSAPDELTAATGRHRIGPMLGEGPWCCVFAGTDTDTSRSVAVKQLRSEFRNSQSRVQRLVAEARRAQSLRIEGLAAVYEALPTQGQIVRERLEGSLQSTLDQGPVTETTIETLLRQGLEILASLHEAGTLHGNLKPTNLFFDGTKVKLADGALVDIGTSASSLLVAPGANAYAGPEVIATRGGVLSASSDLYALGMTMLHALCGPGFHQRVHGAGKTLDGYDRLWRRWAGSKRHAPIDPVLLVPGISPRLAKLLKRLVERNFDRRYRSASEALADLGAMASAACVQQPSRRCVAPAATSPAAAAPVQLVVASGETAGQVLAAGAGEFAVVCTAGCLQVVTTAETRRTGNQFERGVSFRHDKDGWVAIPLGQTVPILHGKPYRETFPAKTGDVLRLGPSGPDFQFVLHEHHQLSLPELSRKYGNRSSSGHEHDGPSSTAMVARRRRNPFRAVGRGLRAVGQTYADNCVVANCVFAVTAAALLTAFALLRPMATERAATPEKQTPVQVESSTDSIPSAEPSETAMPTQVGFT